MSTETRPIASIKIGPRFRKAHRNTQALAKSIAEIGLLHPVVITPDGSLISGEGRIKACLLLGWAEIPVHVIDIKHIVRGELDENEIREPFLPSELVAIGEEVERVEGEEAKQRQGTRTDMVENCHDVDRFGKTRDKVAQRLGTSGKTYEKAKFVVNAAKANPERFGKFVEEMDETRKVDKVYVQVKGQLENDDKRKNPIVCPPGRFAIVGDPPWPIEKYRTEVNSEPPSTDGATVFFFSFFIFFRKPAN